MSLLIYSFLYFIVFVPASYATNNEVGKVLLTRDRVTAQRSNTEVVLKRGSILIEQDEVHLGANGRLQFRTNDGAVFSFQENTVFKINKYSYKKNGTKDIAFFELISGGLRTVTGLIGKGDKKAYELKTPLATIGIRGTMFEVEIVGNDVYVALREGEIDVYSAISGCSPSLALTAGQFLHISSGSCKIISEAQSRRVFERGHSSNVTLDDSVESLNLSDLQRQLINIDPELDEEGRQQEVINIFESNIIGGVIDPNDPTYIGQTYIDPNDPPYIEPADPE